MRHFPKTVKRAVTLDTHIIVTSINVTIPRFTPRFTTRIISTVGVQPLTPAGLCQQKGRKAKDGCSGSNLTGT
jgi:hypothetical protein